MQSSSILAYRLTFTTLLCVVGIIVESNHVMGKDVNTALKLTWLASDVFVICEVLCYKSDFLPGRICRLLHQK